MHICNSKLIKNICPICKTEHKIKFTTEFTKEKDCPYHSGFCPKCNYKIFFETNVMTSGTNIFKKLGLEAKI